MSELNALMCVLRKFNDAHFTIPNAPTYMEYDIIRKIILEPIEDIKEREQNEMETNRSNYDRVISSIAGIKYIAFIRPDIPCLQCYMTGSIGQVSLCKRHSLLKKRFLHPFTYSQFINHFTDFQPNWETIITNAGLSRVRRYHPLYNDVSNNDDIYDTNNRNTLIMDDIRGRKYVGYIDGHGCCNCYAYGSSVIEVCRNCIEDFNAGKLRMVTMDYLDFIHSIVFINPTSFFTYERPGIINNLNSNAMNDGGMHPIRDHIEIESDNYMFMGYVFWGME
jgi:hypothetical protein